MAETFEIAGGAYEDVEFVGGTSTQAVIVTPIRTKPSGIYIEVRVLKSAFEKNGASVVNAAALGWADIFETLAKQPHVGGVQWGQQQAGGQVEDVAIITVVSSSGASSDSLTVPVNALGPKLDETAIAALAKKLNELEAL